MLAEKKAIERELAAEAQVSEALSEKRVVLFQLWAHFVVLARL